MCEIKDFTTDYYFTRVFYHGLIGVPPVKLSWTLLPTWTDAHSLILSYLYDATRSCMWNTHYRSAHEFTLLFHSQYRD